MLKLIEKTKLNESSKEDALLATFYEATFETSLCPGKIADKVEGHVPFGATPWKF